MKVIFAGRKRLVYSVLSAIPLLIVCALMAFYSGYGKPSYEVQICGKGKALLVVIPGITAAKFLKPQKLYWSGSDSFNETTSPALDCFTLQPVQAFSGLWFSPVGPFLARQLRNVLRFSGFYSSVDFATYIWDSGWGLSFQNGLVLLTESGADPGAKVDQSPDWFIARVTFPLFYDDEILALKLISFKGTSPVAARFREDKLELVWENGDHSATGTQCAMPSLGEFSCARPAPMKAGELPEVLSRWNQRMADFCRSEWKINRWSLMEAKFPLFDCHQVALAGFLTDCKKTSFTEEENDQLSAALLSKPLFSWSPRQKKLLTSCTALHSNKVYKSMVEALSARTR